MRRKTFASRAPGKQDKRKETVAQRATRTAFAEASRWAKNVLLDPDKKVLPATRQGMETSQRIYRRN
jgi:hypothetical protein